MFGNTCSIPGAIGTAVGSRVLFSFSIALTVLTSLLVLWDLLDLFFGASNIISIRFFSDDLKDNLD